MIEKHEEIEKNVSQIVRWLDFEKKKILFQMFTFRKLRNISKLKQVIGEVAGKFMMSGCLLILKALYLN